MRFTASPPRPGTESLKTQAFKLDNLNKYHPDLFNFDIDYNTDDDFYISPRDGGSGDKWVKMAWEIGNEKRFYKTTEQWNIDLTTSSINLTTKTGGRIDGLSRTTNQNYILYGFLDANFDFAGIGVGQKPFSAFTGYTGGTRGSTTTLTGITNAYSFVPGARVVVGNTNGAYVELREFNWGTVNTILSDTSLTVDMDNNTNYGVNITSATGGVIRQWDKFRPFVVTTSSQTLYKPYYTVLGEVVQRTSSKIFIVYKKTDTLRIDGSVAFNNNSGSPVTNFTLQLARIIPLWAESINFRANLSAGSTGTLTSITDLDSTIGWYFQRRSVLIADYEMNCMIPLNPFARIRVDKNNNNTFAIVVYQYKLADGGMRL